MALLTRAAPQDKGESQVLSTSWSLSLEDTDEWGGPRGPLDVTAAWRSLALLFLLRLLLPGRDVLQSGGHPLRHRCHRFCGGGHRAAAGSRGGGAPVCDHTQGRPRFGSAAGGASPARAVGTRPPDGPLLSPGCWGGRAPEEVTTLPACTYSTYNCRREALTVQRMMAAGQKDVIVTFILLSLDACLFLVS